MDIVGVNIATKYHNLRIYRNVIIRVVFVIAFVADKYFKLFL